MQKLFMDEKLTSCYLSCKTTFYEVQNKQKQEFIKLLKEQYTRMMKMGMGDVFIAYAKGDALSGLKAVNAFIEKNGRNVVLEMQKDLIKLYENNKDNIDAVCKCYLKNCDKDAVEMTIEIVKFVKNIITIFSDSSVQKQIGTIYKKINDNLEYAMKVLTDVKGTPHVSTRSSSSSKGTSKTPRKSKKINPK